MNSAREGQKSWLAPPDVRLPDFIICGAMKSGTSTLHALLNAHPDIYIPEGELSFFDIDDAVQHPEYRQFIGNQWLSQAIEQNPTRFWHWYGDFFKAAPEGCLLGEDSTTYLASVNAAQRIALQNKPIKVIIMLRQPAERAYSQYWHMLRNGLLGGTFEQVLQHSPAVLLQRSLYREQLETFYRYLQPEQIKVILFEEFVSQPGTVMTELTEFLGVDFEALPMGVLDTHENSAQIPRFIRLQQWRNRLLGDLSRILPRTNLPVPLVVDRGVRARAVSFFSRLHRRFNPLKSARPPAMLPETRRYLDAWFKQDLEALNALLGRDLTTLWFGKDENVLPN